VTLRRKLIACFVAAVFGASSSTPALAQPSGADDIARARELFVLGTDLRNAGDAAAALEKLKAARDLAPNPITAVELGRTYAMLGMLLEAREAFLSVAAMAVQPDETARATQARQDAAKLAEDTKREIDRIAASIQARETTSPSPAPTAPTETARGGTPTESRGLGPIAYAGLGVGVVSFVVGGVLTVMSISKASSAQDACSGGTCPQSAKDDAQSARSLGFASILFYGLAAGAVAVGVVDVIVNPPRSGDPRTGGLRLAPRIGPGWAGVSASF
jgi:hypothetical protein